MADFDSGVQPVNQQPMTRSPDPIDTTTASAINSAGNILGVVGSTLAQGAAVAQVSGLQKQQASFMENYSQDLLRISDLEQQGVMKPDQALRQYRLRTASMLANHPMMQDEIYKTYGNVVDKAGLGKNVVDDFNTQKDNANQLQMQSLKAAQAAGWGSPNDPAASQQLMAEKHQQFLFAQSQMEAANAVLAHKQKEIELTNAQLQTTSTRQSIANMSITMKRNQLGLANDQAQYQFKAGAQTLSDAYFAKFNQDISNIQKQVGTQVQDPSTGKQVTYTAQMAQQDIDHQLAAIHSQAGGLATAYDSQGTLEALLHPMDMLASTAKDNISGKLDKTTLDNQLSNIQAVKSQQMLSSDDNLLTLATVSKLFPSTASSLQEGLGSATVNLLRKNGLMPGDTQNSPRSTKPGDVTTNGDPDHDKGVGQYFDMVKNGISNIRTGVADTSVKADVDTHLTSILKSIGTYSQTMASPTELNKAVQFFADPQIGKYLRDNPAIIQDQNAGLAHNAYIKDYQQVVLPLVQDEFQNANVRVGNTYDTSSPAALRVGGIIREDQRPSANFIHTEFNGTNVAFVANDPTIGDTNREAQRLNREVAPVLSNLVRANAHFAGSTDYKSSYQNLMNQLQIKSQTDTKPIMSTEQAITQETGIDNSANPQQ